MYTVKQQKNHYWNHKGTQTSSRKNNLKRVHINEFSVLKDMKNKASSEDDLVRGEMK